MFHLWFYVFFITHNTLYTFGYVYITFARAPSFTEPSLRSLRHCSSVPSVCSLRPILIKPKHFWGHVGPNHIGSVCWLRSVCSPRSACLSCSPRYACLPCSPCSLRLFCLLRPIFDRVWLKLNCTIWQHLYNTEKLHTAFNICKTSNCLAK